MLFGNCYLAMKLLVKVAILMGLRDMLLTCVGSMLDTEIGLQSYMGKKMQIWCSHYDKMRGSEVFWKSGPGFAKRTRRFSPRIFSIEKKVTL